MKKTRKRGVKKRRGFIYKTTVPQHKEFFPYLMHDLFEESWAVYISNANNAVSIIKVNKEQLPNTISSGEDEIIAIGSDDSYYIINPFLGDGKGFDKTRRKTKSTFARMGANSFGCPTSVLLAAGGSVDTELFS